MTVAEHHQTASVQRARHTAIVRRAQEVLAVKTIVNTDNPCAPRDEAQPWRRSALRETCTQANGEAVTITVFRWCANRLILPEVSPLRPTPLLGRRSAEGPVKSVLSVATRRPTFTMFFFGERRSRHTFLRSKLDGLPCSTRQGP